MNAVNVPFRLKPLNLCYASQSPFQAKHEARVDRPLDDLDLKEVFQDVQANLRVGDEVTICAYRESNWKQLMEIGVCRVVFQGKDEANRQRTRAVWVGAFFQVPKEEQAPAPNRAEQKLEIKKQFGGGYVVQDDKGHVIESVKTKAEAEAYIERLNPKKVEPKAA